MKISARHNIWEIKESPEEEVLHLCQKKDIDATIAHLLISRDISMDSYEDFINPSLKNQMPDPFVLKDCEKACKMVADSIEANEKITIYGDYDVDGGTSTSVFMKFLRELNANVDFYIPNKLEEGYGPNQEAFKKLESEGTQLLITVDCGISAFDSFEDIGFKTIIVDHHMAEERLPKADAIVDPKRLDDDSGLDGLAGVGVSFLVCVAINRELEQRGFFKTDSKPNLMNVLDLVALGTVCDVMKLKKLNRVFVAQGLKVLNKKTNIGLKALADLLEINKELDTYHLGFVFGPRLNAGGRLGGSELATKLMICEDYNEASKLAQQLNDLNEERKEIEGNIYQEALEQLQPHVIDGDLTPNNAFVFNQDWHSGVLGIVASRLKEKFGKPSFAVTCDDGIAHGSARSIQGVDLGSIVVLGKQKGILKDGGGHKMAAGFSCDVEKLEEVKKFLTDQINKHLDGEEIINTIYIDAALSIKGANLDLLHSLELLAPFGNGNPRPKFCIEDLKIAKTMVLKEKHIKCFFSSPYTKGTLEGIVFNAVDSRLGNFLLAKHEEPIAIAGTLDKNVWNGRETVQFMIEDAR